MSAEPSVTGATTKTKPTRPSHRRGLSGITPRELKYIDSVIPLDRRQKWKKYSIKPIESTEDFEQCFVQAVETTLGRSLYNCDSLAAYQATARAIRDTLIVRWNRTQQKQTLEDPKRVYYLSLEYLMGRALDNATLNLGVKKAVKGGLTDFGFNFEDIIDREPDAGLGNGGLGRLAACFVDSLCTLDYPAWAYGIRYKYGIFRQKIIDGYQVEFPDTWLDFGNPWEIPRQELSFDVMFYGRVTEENGQKKWIGGDLVEAKAFDFLVPGYQTNNVNTLRLWEAEPSSQFDFAKFNEGDYTDAVAEQVDASTISAVLYPNDNFYQGKELRLKQQYFWVAASLADIVRRFKKTQKSWASFPDACSIQLNDTHPTLAIVELLRILVDLEKLDWHEAWAITTSTFAYTNHTVMPEALEKWGVDILGNLLPRHLEIIYNINYFFLKDVGAKFPNDGGLQGRVSLIEESTPKQVRMAYLAVIGSKKVNGVAELHSELIKTTIFKDFVMILGEKHFTNITNGITPRRWLLEANPDLSGLIASKLGGYGFIKNLDKLNEIRKYVQDAEFRKQWNLVKEENKKRLVALIKSQHPEVEIDPTALFDIQVKRIHEYKRQQLNLFGIIYRYLYLKSLTPEQRQHITPRVSIFGGKSAPGYYAAKVIIKLINAVGKTIAADPDVNKYLKVIYIEEYNVSKAQVLVSASDISEHISTAGTEASGTSNMKFVLNGGLIIGTVDGANIEIGREVGEENIYFFGHLSEAVDEVREESGSGVNLSEKLSKVFETIDSGVFGDAGEYASLLDSVRSHGDYYLVNADFDSYIETQSKIDLDFKDKEAWTTRSINAVSHMGFFSSDRAIKEYAENIWDIFPCPVEGQDPIYDDVSEPSAAHGQHHIQPVSAAQGVSSRTAPSEKKSSSGAPREAATAASLAAGAAAAATAAIPNVHSTSNTTHGIPGSTTNHGTAPSTHRAPAFTSAPIGGDFPVSNYNDDDAASSNYGSTANLGSFNDNKGEFYDPAGTKDEGPVGSTQEHATYGSAGASPTYTSAGQVPAASHGELKSTDAFEPVTYASDKREKYVEGEFNAVGTGSYDPYGKKGDPGVKIESTSLSQGAPSGTNTTNKDPSIVEGEFNAVGTGSYDPYGKKGDPGVKIESTSLSQGAPSGTNTTNKDPSIVEGEFNAVGTGSYDPYGNKGDPGVAIEQTSLSPNAAGASATGNTTKDPSIVEGSYEGEGTSTYNPYGNKADPAIKIQETSLPSTNTGIFSELSSVSSMETSGPEITQNPGDIRRNLSDPNESATSVSTTTPSKSAADTSFSGPSSESVPKDGASYSDKAIGLAAGAGAAIAGTAGAVLGAAKGDSSATGSDTGSTGAKGANDASYLEQAQGLAAGAGASVTGAIHDAFGTSGSSQSTAQGTAPAAKATSSSGHGVVDQATGALAGAGAAVTGAIHDAFGTSGSTEGSEGSAPAAKTTSSSSPGVIDQATGTLAGAGAAVTGALSNALGTTDSSSAPASKSPSGPGVVDRATGTLAGAGASATSAVNSAIGSVSGNGKTSDGGYLDKAYAATAGAGAAAAAAVGSALGTVNPSEKSGTAGTNSGPDGAATGSGHTDVPISAKSGSDSSETGARSGAPIAGSPPSSTGARRASYTSPNASVKPGSGDYKTLDPAAGNSKYQAGLGQQELAIGDGPAQGTSYDPRAKGDESGINVETNSSLTTTKDPSIVEGEFNAVGTGSYDPYGKKGDPGVKIESTSLSQGAPSGTNTTNKDPSIVEGEFNAVGTGSYDPYGKKSDPGVKIESTSLSQAPKPSTGAGAAGIAGATGATGTAGGSSGIATQGGGYDPTAKGDERGVGVEKNPNLTAPKPSTAPGTGATSGTGSSGISTQGSSYDPRAKGDESGVGVEKNPNLTAPKPSTTPSTAGTSGVGGSGISTQGSSYDPGAKGDESGINVEQNPNLTAPKTTAAAGAAGAGAAGAGAAGAGIASQPLKNDDAKAASVRSLDSRTAPVPDSGATVSGGGLTSRTAQQYNDGRRYSKGSYQTTGDTDFEDALDDDYGHHGYQHGYDNHAGASRAADTDSVSSQSTIGKFHGAAPAGIAATSAAPAGTAAGATAGAPVSSGTAASGATASSRDTRPETANTAATASSHTEPKQKASVPSTGTGAHSDLIPTAALKKGVDATGGDGSAIRGPDINSSLVEKKHDEVIAAAKAEGDTEGITEKQQAGTGTSGAPTKGAKAGKEGEAVEAPEKKKSCICC